MADGLDLARLLGGLCQPEDLPLIEAAWARYLEAAEQMLEALPLEGVESHEEFDPRWR